MKTIQTLGFIGCGNMGEAFLSSVLDKKVFLDEHITVMERSSARRDYIRNTYHVFTNKNTELFWKRADILFLAIKPQQLDSLECVNFRGSLIISIMAGVSIKKIQKKFPEKTVVRAMPNLGQFTGNGMTGIYFPENTTETERSIVLDIFEAGGKVITLEEESQINAVTAISGSGPAYYFYFTEGLINAAIKLGLTEEQARMLARQTLLGSANILEKNPDDSTKLWRKRVTSKGGTTAAALDSFQSNNLENIIEEAAKAALKRAEELS